MQILAQFVCELGGEVNWGSMHLLLKNETSNKKHYKLVGIAKQQKGNIIYIYMEL